MHALYPLSILFLYRIFLFIMRSSGLYLNYVIILLLLLIHRHTHTRTHTVTHTCIERACACVCVCVYRDAYLGKFSICKEFKQRTFAHNAVADENQAKLIIEDWLNHVWISLVRSLSLSLSVALPFNLHNHKHTHTRTELPGRGTCCCCLCWFCCCCCYCCCLCCCCYSALMRRLSYLSSFILS